MNQTIKEKLKVWFYLNVTWELKNADYAFVIKGSIWSLLILLFIVSAYIKPDLLLPILAFMAVCLVGFTIQFLRN